MKKLLLFASLFGAFSFAQVNFENGGFETWEGSGPELEPVDWSSLKTGTGVSSLSPVVLFQSTDSHSGTYSAELRTDTYFWTPVNGTMTNGRVAAPTTDPEDGYVFTDDTDGAWNTECTDRPDSLVGWFKYTPAGTDVGKVEVLLHDGSGNGQLPDSPTPAGDWIGKARYDFTGTTSAWTRFSVPFTYYSTDAPTHFLAVCAAGDSTVSTDGSVLLLDDLELIYNKEVSIAPTADQFIDVSTDGDELTATETPIAADSREWKFSTTSGSGYTSFGTAETGLTYTPNFAAAGTYFVICESTWGAETNISEEVTIFVTDPLANSVVVSPAASQTILLGEDGATLTATESPSAAASREWKFSTTSGSGYGAFATAETGTTYVPNFSTLGTYYVVCESDFGTETVVSNEVEIIVPSAAGIDTEDLNFHIQNINGMIQLSLSSFENAKFFVYSLNGQVVYESNLTNEVSTHDVQASSGVYVYNVVVNGKVISGKIQL